MQFHWNNLFSKKQRCDTKKAEGYYKNNKKVLKEIAKNKYRELSEEDKNVKREYGRNRYKNMSKESREKL